MNEYVQIRLWIHTPYQQVADMNLKVLCHKEGRIFIIFSFFKTSLGSQEHKQLVPNKVVRHK